MEQNLKYFICLFKKDGHETWRIMIEGTMEAINSNLALMKVTRKKFFEVNRLTGKMEEF